MRRGMPVEEATKREILRKQMELLAEASFSTTEPKLADFSQAMVSVNKELTKPVWVLVFGVIGINFLVCFEIFFKKLCRS